MIKSCDYIDAGAKNIRINPNCGNNFPTENNSNPISIVDPKSSKNLIKNENQNVILKFLIQLETYRHCKQEIH